MPKMASQILVFGMQNLFVIFFLTGIIKENYNESFGESRAKGVVGVTGSRKRH